MKKITFLFFLFLAMSSFVSAQSPLAEFDKVKEIRLLESNREDVKKILAGYKSDDAESFSTKNGNIEITYSTGDCSDDSDDTDEWNVSEGKVKEIEISFDEPAEFKDFNLYVSSFQKEQRYSNDADLFFYHNKSLGIAFKVRGDKLETILLFPTKNYSSLLCANEEAENLKEFYSKESFFKNSELKDRYRSIEDVPANVADLTLDAVEIIIGCDDSAEHKSCSNSKTEISVATSAVDPENDVLTCEYTVSGGKVVGSGANVVWNLWGIEPGTYTITAGVDDSCGVCGRTVTKTVVIKKCSDCVKDK